jgi:hypothetical protein
MRIMLTNVAMKGMKVKEKYCVMYCERDLAAVVGQKEPTITYIRESDVDLWLESVGCTRSNPYVEFIRNPDRIF